MPDELIQLERITRRFGGVTALNAVSFSIREGEVHAIVGENGAGKSTLMKLLAGVDEPDEGRIVLRGGEVRLRNPKESRRQGVSIVFQELNLLPHRSVMENIFVGRELTRGGFWLDKRAMREHTRQTLESMGMEIAPDAAVGSLSMGEKQLVEIARTLQQRSRIIILDEPNSALSEHESARLFEIIRRLKDQGVTILFISHRLEEVFAIADRITVLRDGRFVGTFKTSEVTIPRIIQEMIGRAAGQTFPERAPIGSNAPVVLSVRQLRGGSVVGPVGFELRKGEILGFAGLEGSGVDELFGILFGLKEALEGEVLHRGERVQIRNPLEAIGRRLALIPASRRDEGLNMDWTIRRNTTLLVLGKLLNRIGLIDRRAADQLTREYVERLGIVTDSLEKKVVHLSGGNQQKVLLAKWLATGPEVLILNDPTRGVDIGAKQEIYRLCNQLARQGMGILLTSSEGQEIVGLCDRVLVFYRGRVHRELARGEANHAELMHCMSGG